MVDNKQRHQLVAQEMLRLVAHPYRRDIIQYLMRNGDGTVSCDELCDSLRTNSGAETPSQESNKTLLIQLHHSHLPKLAEADVIEYDPDHGTVEYQSVEPVEKLVTFIELELR